ncbi:hypothetical protein A7K91_00105 [Paenibacillus oryzae]|uniref:Uncharacterized protein n=1 Tax=Paenibacillus oryzae TaxID=1844972 RepID=A0A1A5YM65_9BACL|nr:hypothetical protein [Paenibacillus oryzae]OBR66721.1 hypothetical protein A7K91_00105 [Paenibacillus oryzae]
MEMVEARKVISFGGLMAYKAKKRGIFNNAVDYYLDIESLSMALGMPYKNFKESLEMVAKASLVAVYVANGSRKLAIRVKDMNLVCSCFAERIDAHLLSVIKSKVKRLQEEIELERGNRR